MSRLPQVTTARSAGSSGTGSAPIYLDNQASTPMDETAFRAMAEAARTLWANPSSPHRSGQRAAAAVERAREQVARAISALPEEIVFTSGATESNNLAILGVARFALARGAGRRAVVTLPVEHPSVLAPARHLESLGFELRLAPVGPDGRVRLDALESLLDDGVLLLGIQAANNEIGTIQPVAEAARLAHEQGVIVHCDAAQALGKTPFDVEALDLDLASLSAHKCHGPKGVGALWVRGGARTAPLAPITHGGGHERGLRPGTQNTPGIVGFGEAAHRAVARLDTDAARLGALRDDLETRILTAIPDTRINGARNHRVPHATSITFPGADADAIVANLPDLDLSAASACHAGTPEPSHVLRAIGLTAAEAQSTLRLALPRDATAEVAERAAKRILEAADRVGDRSSRARP